MDDQQQHNLTENDAASYGSAALDPAVYSDGNLDPNVSGSLDSSSAKQPHLLQSIKKEPLPSK